MDDELLTRFFDTADRVSAEAYGLHRGRADFVCPICGGIAYVEGVRGHGAACCPTCGLLIARGTGCPATAGGGEQPRGAA